MFKKILVLLLGICLIVFGVLRLKKDKPIEEPGYLKFINGNSLIKENKTKEALEEYKLAMDTNEDINIKKNFEIIENKIEQEKQNQDQNQKNDDNQEKNEQNKNDSQDNNNQNNQQNKENSQQQQNDKDKKENQQNNSKQDENQKNNDNQQQNQQEKQENTQQNSEQNKGSASKELTQEEKAMKQKEEELRSILQRLEGNEKQAFKNNERVLNTSENKNSESRW